MAPGTASAGIACLGTYLICHPITGAPIVATRSFHTAMYMTTGDTGKKIAIGTKEIGDTSGMNGSRSAAKTDVNAAKTDAIAAKTDVNTAKTDAIVVSK